MKKILIALLCVLTFFACLNNAEKPFSEVSYAIVKNNIDTIIVNLQRVEKVSNADSLKSIFVSSRKSYKKLEPIIEYYYQGLSRRINGPALPEIKTDDNIVNDATGFQVIEEIIYSDSLDLVELNKQAKILTTDLLFVKKTIQDMPMQDHHFYEMMQHQIIRIAALGITGFDSPVAFESIQEAGYALEGIREWYNAYCKSKNKKAQQSIIVEINKAISYTENNKNFNSFNRLLFIKNNLMPLSKIWEDDFKTVIAASSNLTQGKVFYGTLENLMQGKKLNPDAFSPYSETASTPQKVALGKLLFNDVSLSKNNTISCATCHNENKAFTDGKVTSVTNIHNNIVKRNAPSVLYSGFQKSYFYDLRSQDLENQIESVINNPQEFDLTPQQINKKVQANATYAVSFKEAYPNKKEITAFELRNAIAAYVRSLMPFTAKIDAYFKGDVSLSESEMNGFNVFTGKAKCATCHFIPLYNGTVPPWYNNSESEVIGVPQSIEWSHAKIDKDLGRYILNQLEPLRYSFKTPTIRNNEKTAPYMHNGVYKTLDEVIRFYELGGGNGIGMNLEYQTLPFDNLSLTAQEKIDLINFLKTLTDKSK
jgi:cytochrome c peroxidase